MAPAQRTETLDMHAADVAGFRSDISYLQRTLDTHVQDDKDVREEHLKIHNLMFEELNKVKRLVWIQIGGIAALAWIVGITGHDILKYLK